MFTRVGEAAYKPNLDNTYALLHALGDPHLMLKCIHIAGTNGKGSTSNMLAAVLQSAGYKTGLYTSPHLLDFRERIRIDGKMISKKYVSDFVTRNQEIFQEIKPSFFEMTVALCFEYFARKKVDIAVIETGLGGRLDSTNVIHPLISIITNIGLDHTNLLGNSLEAIAMEKAGIIKEKTPVVIGETDPKTKSVFIRKAKEMNSEIYFADQCVTTKLKSQSNNHQTFDVGDGKKTWISSLKVTLAGHYQQHNITTALQSIKLLKPHFNITNKNIINGMGHIQKYTSFAGRWQAIQKNPLVILDTGHNAHGLSQSLTQLKKVNATQTHFIFGVVQDKKLDDILTLLPKNFFYHLCAPQLPRALPASQLKAIFETQQLKHQVYKNVTDAYKSALKSCKRNDVLFVGGSTFVVAEVMEYLKKKKLI